MQSDSYLVLIEDDDLAHAVAAELEYQLGRDGHDATAVIPATRGPGFTYQPADQASPRPIAVAFYQAGLLEALEPLGLSAYIGIPADERPATITWDHGTTAFLLPVTTARDLTDAIAVDAARQRSHTAPPRRAARPPAPPALTRRLTIASVAGLAGITGSLLAMTLPAAATTTHPHPPARHPITATLTDSSTSGGTTASPAPTPSTPAPTSSPTPPPTTMPTPSPLPTPISTLSPLPRPNPTPSPSPLPNGPTPGFEHSDSPMPLNSPAPTPSPTPSPSPNPYGGGL